jgi:hypothetical protein
VRGGGGASEPEPRALLTSQAREKSGRDMGAVAKEGLGVKQRDLQTRDRHIGHGNLERQTIDR